MHLLWHFLNKTSLIEASLGSNKGVVTVLLTLNCTGCNWVVSHNNCEIDPIVYSNYDQDKFSNIIR